MKKYDDMSTEELNNEIKRLKDLLEEVIEEREMIFSTTGIHRSVQYHVVKYETEINEIKENIDHISRLAEGRAAM
ncbi:hypothetical protein [Sporobacter termitidis]|nr:hypothetical protein [Sporobacter termitidis]